MKEKIKNILVVDDEEETIKSIKRHLKRKGFLLNSANDGIEARRKISTAMAEGKQFDLVITDVYMPGEDGLSLFQWLKETHPTVSVLVISGFGVTDLVMDAVRSDRDIFCPKPLTPGKMIASIHCIEQKRKNLVWQNEKDNCHSPG